MLTKYEFFKEILNKEFQVICDKTRKGKTCGYVKKYEDGYTHYYIKVIFDDTGEVQEFYFPDAFKIHLQAVAPEIQRKIINPPPPSPPLKSLRFYELCGTNSRDIYVKCCLSFGWDISKKDCFGMRTLMYAEKCTPENYSVWFIPHNNLFEPYNENGHWYNFIKGNIIEKIWIDYENWSLRNDWADRVTFIKTKEGHRFYGVYRPQEVIEKEINHKIRKVKIYKQISIEYTVSAKEKTDMTFKIRIPSFAKNVCVDGKKIKNSGYVTVFGFDAGDTVIDITFDTEAKVVPSPTRGLYNVKCGSLIFSANIEAEWTKREYTKNGVERKFPYCDYSITPLTDWNFAFASKELTVNRGEVGDVPFSSKNPPVTIGAKMCHIDWGYEFGYNTVCAKKPMSRKAKDEPFSVKLYPYGCAKLRMTELPMAIFN